MKILITGAGGLLGRALMRHLGARHQVVGLDRNPKDFPCRGKWIKVDFLKIKKLKDLLQKTNPDVVIHTVAKIDVDDCEKKPKEAVKQNEILTKKILKAMPRKTKIVYISTDQVFEGQKPFAKEEDPTRPVNVYGRTKLAAEQIVKKSGHPYLILRTNFFGWSSGRKKNFGEWLIQSLRKKIPIQLFDDFYFTPIYVGKLAKFIAVLLLRRANGTYHLAGRDRVSKYKFGRVLSKVGGFSFSQVRKTKLCLDTGLVRRPKDLSLNTALVKKKYFIQAPRLQESLKQFLADEKIVKSS